MHTRLKLAPIFLLLLTLTPIAHGYPIDGYDDTHIRRLEAANRNLLPPGAGLPSSAVVSTGHGVTSLPATDVRLSEKLRTAVGNDAPLYSVAVLDLSDPEQPRYAAHNENTVANIGSVGKVLVLYALFDKLARLYPDDIASRERLLRETLVTADEWIISNSHVVPIFDPASGNIVSRKLHIGDTGNLWEYLDWMLSASSNAAASMVIQQVILLEHFGRDYPVAPPEAQKFLDGSSANRLGGLWQSAMERPLREAGFDPGKFRQGTPFTATAKRHVNGPTSVGNVRDLVRLLSLVEAGQFVDAWSSREAKRLLYMTQRRIRYASHPVLNDAAVYFKSGSFYSCEPEPDFVCGKYRGNKVNRLASIAIIESPAGAPRLHYIVAVMSNVLRVNSAVAHQTLAMRIHRLIEAANKERMNNGTPSESGEGR